ASGSASSRTDDDEPPAGEEHVAAAELVDELLGQEEALEHGPHGPVADRSLLPLVGLVARSTRRIRDDDLAGDAARLAEERLTLRRFEMAVEVAGEQTLERAVCEGQREGVAEHVVGVWRLLAGDGEHRVALVEADDVAAEVARQETGAAGDVERAGGWEVGDDMLQLGPFAEKALALFVCVERPVVPVVVLGRAAVVVLAQGGPRLRPWPTRSKRCPTSR